jgi:hypothetical protein
LKDQWSTNQTLLKEKESEDLLDIKQDIDGLLVQELRGDNG